jgi:hypothetical protein
MSTIGAGNANTKLPKLISTNPAQELPRTENALEKQTLSQSQILNTM